ncbi:Hypp6139 [Branchiostoma lanceolatum]|uniref:Hypp6139 protein n=1 Tax=Branchiostoma lanceolatum TaxID=7740 RepID=A0A8J9YQ36_BRALA|nr:Hypp6139 [Branchiostoma lanceolatum]
MEPTKVGSWKRAVTSGDGTSKAAEGYGFELIWEEMGDKGMAVETHWQDADSTSEKLDYQHRSESGGLLLANMPDHQDIVKAVEAFGENSEEIFS